MSYFLAHFSLIKYAIYLVFWHLFQCFKDIFRAINGSSKIKKNEARLHKILFRHHRSPGELQRREDFVTLDVGFVAKDVLLGPNWTVFSLDKDGAIFVEMPYPITHYSIEKYPFIYPHLFSDSLRAAEIDLQTFHSFGNELESDPNFVAPKCLFFTNTARSTSTLFGAMLHHEGHSIVIGEHPAFTNLSLGLAQHYWSKEEVLQLLIPTVKLLRRHIPPSQLIVFKGRSMEASLVPFISQQFPEIKHIFMFRRNGLPSVERMVTPSLIYLTLCEMYYRIPAITTFLTSLVWETLKELKPKTVKEAAMIIYAEPYCHYQNNKKLFDFPIVWHDELIAAPTEILAPIFEKLGIPSSCISVALDRMNHDSQKGTFLCQKRMKHISASEMTPEAEERIVAFAKRFQMELDVLGI